MRYLLAAINAKYIHSNLGIYSLRRYAMERLGLGQKDEQGAAVGMEMVSEAAEGANRTKTVSEIQIDLGEYTINHQMIRFCRIFTGENRMWWDFPVISGISFT